MKDLTVIYLTVNKVPEKWAKYQQDVLIKAIGDTPLISMSMKPMDFGKNIIQDGEISMGNIYRQMLRAAKIAETPYVAIAEDDVLYFKDHFIYRPPLDTFAYDMCRWGLLTWGEVSYYWKYRLSNAMLIAPRELMIKCLEERYAKFPNGISNYRNGELGNNRKERLMGVTENKTVVYYPTIACVYLSHIYSIDPLEQTQRKRRAMVRAFDIPYWGRAEELLKKFV